MMVKFANLCDLCGQRSEEYSRWPMCEDCDSDVCPKCVAEAICDWDYDQTALVRCVNCTPPLTKADALGKLNRARGAISDGSRQAAWKTLYAAWESFVSDLTDDEINDILFDYGRKG